MGMIVAGGDPVKDVQHLLRHIDDAHGLRSNAIVGHLFVTQGRHVHPLADQAVLARIRAVITGVANMLQSGNGARRAATARRQYAIITRCDLGGELHKIVAAELGLSERQFYRERQRACERLGEMLVRELSAPERPSTSVPTEFSMRFNSAVALRHLGQLEAALALLRGLAEDSSNPDDKSRIGGEIVQVLCDAGRITEAKEALGTLESAHSNVFARAEFEIARARVCWESGDAREAIAANERALKALQPAGEYPTERGMELAAHALVSLGVLQRETGDNLASLATLAGARELIAGIENPAPALPAYLHISLGATYAVTSGGLSKATAELLEGLAHARNNNLLGYAVGASSTLCAIAIIRGQAEEALTYGRSAFALGRIASSAEDFAYCCLNLARAEGMLHRYDMALDHVMESRLRLERDSVLWPLSEVTEAEILLLAGAPERARALAATAAAKLAHCGVERYLGSALRIQAEALAATAHQREAQKVIDTAVAILERRGHPFSLLQAYQCSAKLTGNARHQRFADELYATLQ